MKKKVLFILPSLRGGGAERVMVTLLKHVDRDKFDLHLALVSKEGPYLTEVPYDVPIYDLGAKRVRYAFVPMLKLIRQLKPDIVFSTLGHLNIALIILRFLMLSHTRLIVREANTVSEIVKLSSKSWLWKFLYKTFYKQADLVICQSDYMKQDLIENFKVPEQKAIRIYNPVDVDTIRKKANLGENPFLHSPTSPNIVAIGRLVYQKGFDRLLQAMPQLLKEKPNAKLWILGEGPLEEELKEQCIRLGIVEKVEFVGFQKNPYVWLKHADLFVLSSYYEGLPNVLLEAIACGCPVVAVDHPGGTREVMEALGLLDRLEYAELTLPLHLFRPLNEECLKQLSQLFGLERIVREYESYLSNL
ncbi:glycosyltransferase [Saccharococcus caldoxylosilyticus]|uniref:Putative glycosyltransferase n=1 Tax=Parageobacillus caldoxylosilyticus NBRC 107762 TaxID=1220594 RepID=A0A023DAH5_9BACL|nr:glycosyltransferase [Parageobacillus caldoxylosilyticus]MBB3851074.1 glycosyltransferase involved in cell wall biosynthesis [Parageobacillus caldoxylosilyticus]GAJ38354.1 putative glycosyltransferase [Parageobacillus caldoxylosilyticus NBRC 107762]